jgi:excisionase family DNA binding protein
MELTPESSPDPLAPTVKRLEVAKFLRCTPTTVDRLAKAGKLRSFKVGRSVRFQRADVLAFAGQRRQEPSTDHLVDHIKRLVDGAPPVTPDQLARIGAILKANAK